MTRQEFLTLQLAALDALERKELCYGCAVDDFYGQPLRDSDAFN